VDDQRNQQRVAQVPARQTPHRLQRAPGPAVPCVASSRPATPDRLKKPSRHPSQRSQHNVNSPPDHSSQQLAGQGAHLPQRRQITRADRAWRRPQVPLSGVRLSTQHAPGPASKRNIGDNRNRTDSDNPAPL
jgi:hypothetical protein